MESHSVHLQKFEARESAPAPFHGIRLVALTTSALLAGCSGQLDPADDCIQEFVQEYTFEDGSRTGGKYCDGQDLSGPPEFPLDSTRIRIEYTDGSFFTVQKQLIWQGEQNPDDLHCQLVWQQERVVYIKNARGKEEVVVTVDGKLIEGDREQRRYRASVLFGAGHTNAPLRNEKPAANRQTEFGIDCSVRERRISQWTGIHAEACMPISPQRQCHASGLMLPMELSGEIEGTPVSGKTTSFRYGKKGTLVDPSKWTMPE